MYKIKETLKKIIKSKVTLNIIVFICYMAIAMLANGVLLNGNNSLKWDAYDMHYPICSYLGDAISQGQIPLWNPMVNYGAPQYATMGMPVWYPTTVILSIFGLSLIKVSFEYVLHVAIAAFGGYLFIKNNINKEDKYSYFVSFIFGLLYGFSGLFISNAQHMSIIISAAWLPYVLYFLDKYMERKKIIYIFMCSFIAGLTVLGGYPELLVATYITMVLYAFIKLLIKKDYKIKIKDIVRIIKTVFIIGVLMILCASVTIIPFANMFPQITRNNANAVDDIKVMEYTNENLYTLLVPGMIEYTNMEVSMTSMYMGILTIMLLILSFGKDRKKTIPYIIFAILALIIIFGSDSPIYMLMHKYIFLFKFFRFPSLWRCILAIILMVPASNTLYNFITDKNYIKNLKVLNLIIFILVVFVFIQYNWGNLLTEKFDIGFKFAISMVFLLGYLSILNLIKSGKLSNIMMCVLVALVIMEVITFHTLDFATVIGTGDKSNDISASVLEKRLEFRKREKELDFSDLETTTTKDNTQIIFNRLLSSRGYLAYNLDSSHKYVKSNAYKFFENQEVIFFTNNIQTGEEITLQDWLDKESFEENEIFIENSKDSITKAEENVNADIKVEKFDANSVKLKVTTDGEGILVLKQNNYPGWKLTVNNEEKEILTVNGTFRGIYLEEGTYDIEFEFVPMDFYIGLILSSIYYLLFLIVIIRELINKRKEKLNETN